MGQFSMEILRCAGSALSGNQQLLGVLKYPAPYGLLLNSELTPALRKGPEALRLIDRDASTPPKCYFDCEKDVVNWVLEPLPESERDMFTAFIKREGKHAKTSEKSLDCSIMDVADDIAYGIHDLEDAIALDLITEKTFRDKIGEEKCAVYLDALKQRYPGESANNVYEQFVTQLFGGSDSRKHAISRLVYFFISDVIIEERSAFSEPLLKFRARLTPRPGAFLEALKDLVVATVIKTANVQHLEFKGQTMVVAVFEVLASEPQNFLPPDAFRAYKGSGQDLRIICDHVAGMTDAFLMRTYERLFSPRMGSVFDRL